MTEPDIRLFRLLDPDGKEIMNGPMSAIMERLPSNKARNDALDEMLQTAVQAVEAEQRRDEAIHSTAQMIAGGVAHLSARMDAFEARREAQRKADAEEAEREEQQQIQETLDALPSPDDPSQFPAPSLTPDPVQDQGAHFPTNCKKMHLRR